VLLSYQTSQKIAFSSLDVVQLVVFFF